MAAQRRDVLFLGQTVTIFGGCQNARSLRQRSLRRGQVGCKHGGRLLSSTAALEMLRRHALGFLKPHLRLVKHVVSRLAHAE